MFRKKIDVADCHGYQNRPLYLGFSQLANLPNMGDMNRNFWHSLHFTANGCIMAVFPTLRK